MTLNYGHREKKVINEIVPFGSHREQKQAKKTPNPQQNDKKRNKTEKPSKQANKQKNASKTPQVQLILTQHLLYLGTYI